LTQLFYGAEDGGEKKLNKEQEAMKKVLSLVATTLFIFSSISSGEIKFVGSGFTPEPNQEVTVQIHTDTPLFSLALGIYVVGDANITGAMCEADCNQYGWDNGWDSDPYIDPNGYVSISGISWAHDANGVVGYIKFRYNSWQVRVYIDQENSAVYDYTYTTVPLSTEVLYFGEPDPNEPNYFNDPNDANEPNEPNETEETFIGLIFPNLAGDANIINFEDFAAFAIDWQQSGEDLAGDFDNSSYVDFNDLEVLCYYWLAGMQTPEDILGLFKTALAAGDIEGAVSYIAEISQDKYRDIFEAIEPNLPEFAAGMGQITVSSSQPHEIKYEMLHQNGGQTYSFPVIFIREDDGNWKIFNF
jgi:hypothetical protein